MLYPEDFKYLRPQHNRKHQNLLGLKQELKLTKPTLKEYGIKCTIHGVANLTGSGSNLFKR